MPFSASSICDIKFLGSDLVALLYSISKKCNYTCNALKSEKICIKLTLIRSTERSVCGAGGASGFLSDLTGEFAGVLLLGLRVSYSTYIA